MNFLTLRRVFISDVEHLTDSINISDFILEIKYES